jgi:proto-oncogene tyrosine-protein kinase Ret
MVSDLSSNHLSDNFIFFSLLVWSFGIVGWEVITLGATPYPGIPPQNLYHLLRTGYRMQRPDNCSPQIYILLEACWADDPLKRPSFKVLAAKFESLLGKCAKYLDIESTCGAVSNPLYLSNTGK